MKINIILLAAMLIIGLRVMAQNASPKSFPNTAYWEIVSARAAKIVKAMEMNDAQKELRVQELIAAQYYRLNEIHDTLDAQINRLKKSTQDKDKKAKKMARVDAKCEKKLTKLHKSYLKGLSKELTEEQVTDVKNGMTYNVFTHTWNGYLDMLPDLTDAQKEYIRNALVEAREKAMDAGSSKEKHAWFGKYKGRINNYLSAQGYDLNKASKEWHERLRKQKE